MGCWRNIMLQLRPHRIGSGSGSPEAPCSGSARGHKLLLLHQLHMMQQQQLQSMLRFVVVVTDCCNNRGGCCRRLSPLQDAAASAKYKHDPNQGWAVFGLRVAVFKKAVQYSQQLFEQLFGLFLYSYTVQLYSTAVRTSVFTSCLLNNCLHNCLLSFANVLWMYNTRECSMQHVNSTCVQW